MEARSVTVTIEPQVDEADPRPRGRTLDNAFVGISDSYRSWDAASTQIETNHDGLDALLRRARHDLRLLIDDVDGDLVPTAGIPWFAVPFGRDSLITAHADAVAAASIAAGTLRFLARHQGETSTTSATKQPGQDPARGAPGRAGQAQRVPHSALLRQRRRDAAVPGRPRRVRALDGRPGPGTRAACPTRGARSAGCDRLRRHRWRRLPRVPQPLGGRHPQPGLEGLARFGQPPRWHAGRAADRPGRGPGLRLRRPPRDGRALTRARRRATRSGDQLARANDASALPRGAGVSDAQGPFWAMALDGDEAPHRDGDLQPGPRAVGRPAPRTTTRADRRSADWPTTCCAAGASAPCRVGPARSTR